MIQTVLIFTSCCSWSEVCVILVFLNHSICLFPVICIELPITQTFLDFPKRFELSVEVNCTIVQYMDTTFFTHCRILLLLLLLLFNNPFCFSQGYGRKNLLLSRISWIPFIPLWIKKWKSWRSNPRNFKRKRILKLVRKSLLWWYFTPDSQAWIYLW